MESSLSVSDLLELTKVVSQNVEFEMNIKTYLKITSYIENSESSVVKIKPKINGIRVVFNNSLDSKTIKMNSKFSTDSKKLLKIKMKE